MAGSLGDLFLTVGANIDGFERAMGSVSQQINAVERDANRSFSGFDRIGDRLTSIGTGLTLGVTAPLVAAGGAVTALAANFERGMANVATLLGNISQNEIAKLSADTLELSRRMGVDAVGSTNALYEAISAGVPKGNALDFLQVATQAGIAGLTDTKVAVDGLTTIINSFGLSFSDAKTVADAMFQAVNVGKLTFSELASSVGTASGTAAVLNVDFKELLASAASITTKGFTAAEAFTQLQSAMVALISPNKEMAELLEDLGFESGQALIKAHGLQGALNLLRDATQGNLQPLSDAFGRVEGLKGTLALTGENAKTAAGHMDVLATSGGALDAAFAKIDQTTSRQFDRLLSELKANATELGTNLLPAVNNLLASARPLVAAISEAVDWFAQLPAPVQTGALALAAIAAATGPVVVGVGAMFSAFSTIGSTITAASGHLSTLNTALASSGGLLPVVTAAAIALAGAFVAWQMVSDAKDHVANLNQNISDIIGPLDLFKIKLDETKTSTGLVMQEITPLQGALGAFKDVLTQIGNLNWWEKIKESLGPLGALNTALGSLNKALEGVKIAMGVFPEMDKAVGDAAKKQQDFALASVKVKDEILLQQAAAAKLRDAHDGLKTKLGGVITKQSALAGAVQKSKVKLDDATAAARKFHDEIVEQKVRDYKNEHAALVRQLVSLETQINKEKAAGVSWHDEAIRGATELNKLGLAVADLSNVKIPSIVTQMSVATTSAGDLNDAFGRLGIKSTTEFNTVAAEAAKARDVVLGSNIATDFEKKTAVYKALEAQVAAAKAAGIAVPAEQAAMLDKLKGELDVKLPGLKTPWENFGTEVSTVITNFTQGIAKSLFDGDLSWGEKMKSMLTGLGEAVFSTFIQPATAALSSFISGVLADLLGGKGFGGIFGRIQDIGGAIADIFRGGAGAAGQVAGAAGQAAGAAGGVAGGAAGAAGQAVGLGVQGIAGIVTGAVSAVSGVVGNFQMAGMNKSLDLIEHEVRFSQIHLRNILEEGQKWWPRLHDINLFNYQVQAPLLNEIVAGFEGLTDRILQVDNVLRSHQLPVLEEIRDSLRGNAVREPSVTVKIETFVGTRDFAAQVGDILAGRLRLQGARS